ncbi:MAG: hypothetical protein U0U66_14290 [Cytophagaceae bacterium]
MKVKLFWALLFTSLLVSTSYAQYIDPNAYGYYNYANTLTPRGNFGSARMQALGGAGVALGADLSAASINPAGLGLYNRNDMGMSIGIGFSGNQADYINQVTKDGKSWLGIPNIGITFYTPPKTENSKFQGSTFSLSFTKISNLQDQFSYKGINQHNSFTDYLAQISNGIPESDLQSEYPASNGGYASTIQGLAYQSYLTDPIYQGGSTYRPFSYSRGSQQTGVYSTSSGIYKWEAAYGVNIANKLYLGASLGIQSTRYKMNHTFTETLSGAADNDTLNSMMFKEYDQHRGSGVNLRAGVIYKATDRLRLGFTAITPTSTKIKEEYNFRMVSDFEGNNVIYDGYKLGSFDYATQLTPFTYNYIAPPRFEGGFSYFFNKDGFVTMAIEYVPYTMSKVKVKSDPFLLEGDNNTIKSVYRDVINVKAGVEIRRDNVYYRGGLSYFPDPYIKELDKVNRDQLNISIGMGYRTETFYFDGALVNTRTKGVYSPYSLNNNTAPQADIKYSTYVLTFTAGLLY